MGGAGGDALPQGQPANPNGLAALPSDGQARTLWKSPGSTCRSKVDKVENPKIAR